MTEQTLYLYPQYPYIYGYVMGINWDNAQCFNWIDITKRGEIK